MEAMDRSIQEEILHWILSRVQAGASVIVASHEPGLFLSAATQAVGIKDGRAVSFQQIPALPEERLRLCERLARGQAP
ncbi:MAG: hypothetical protein WCC06_10135 [Candidatus Aminicenantales bacterium]